MRRLLKAIAVIMTVCMVFGGCGKNYPQTDEPYSKQNSASEKDFLVAVPEKDRYMFTVDAFDGDLPDNQKIVKIALSKIQSPGEFGSWSALYGVVDLKERTASYGFVDGTLSEPEISQEYQLTEDDVERYRNAFQEECMLYQAEKSKGWWKIAIEYEDGACHVYDLHLEAYKNGSPENTMIRTYFDKMDVPKSLATLYGLGAY